VIRVAALLIVIAVPVQAADGVSAQAGAAPTSRLQRFLSQPGITGDWRGARPWLDGHGITLAGLYATDILGNPTGGMRHKVRYYHDILVGVTLDLQRLADLPGAELIASMSSRAGTSLSDEDIGNVFNVSQVCCEPQTRLVTLAWQQSLFERRLFYRVGQLCTGDDFVTSPLYALFVTSGIDANPGSVAFNVPFSEYPDATLGAMVEVRPIRHGSLKIGLYNGSFTNPDGTERFDFDTGVLALAEAAYHALLPVGAGLPGHYRLGGYYHSGRFRRLAAPPGSDLPQDVEHGNGGLYAQIDQMLYREPTPQVGLTAFLALVFGPDEAINEFPFFFDAGLVYQGLLPARPGDSAMFGIVYGSFSSDLRAAQAGSPTGQQDFEMVLEWSYVFEIGRWLQLQPDVQYVIKPGGTGRIPDALVLGGQIQVEF
jgi:porin